MKVNFAIKLIVEFDKNVPVTMYDEFLMSKCPNWQRRDWK